jgi:F-type H+-transporting ATPase subunit b
VKSNKKATRITCITAVLSLIFAFALPVLAFADTAEAGAEAEPNNLALLIPNIWEFIPMLIAFIVLWIIFAKVAIPPLMGILDKRAKVISDDLKAAEDAKIESEKVLAAHKAEMDEAKRQASEIVAEAKKTAEAVRAQITEQANAEAQTMIKKAKDAIESEKKAAIADLQAQAADLTVAVAGKLIGSDLSDAEHKQIIERYVNEAGSLNVE